jgi:hypothetical protein
VPVVGEVVASLGAIFLLHITAASMGTRSMSPNTRRAAPVRPT